MADNAQVIWNYFKSKGFSDCGTAGLMGNLNAESGLIPTNLQNTYEKKLGMTDAEYTAAVDSGKYTNFVKDSAGYGLAQWTYWSRKQNLLNYCKGKGKSIGDLNTQLDFLYQELTTSFPTVVNILKIATSVRQASDVVLLQFERPANQGEETKQKRANFGQEFYNRFAKKQEVNSVMGGNSPLVTYTNITKNKTSPRRGKIDTITIHCIVGQWTAKQGCDFFAETGRQASANYIVGKDGSIGLSVDEKDRAWTTGGKLSVNGETGAMNDHHAVTIEVASDTQHPYAVTDAAYKALINLCADICKRNGIKELKWRADKNLVGRPDLQNMTAHRWFAAKACPGDYLYNRFGDIASKVNAILNTGTAVEEDENMTQETFNKHMSEYLKNLNDQPATFEQDALVWAQQNGLLAGDEKGRLMAKRFMTRGECMVVLKRLFDKFLKK